MTNGLKWNASLFLSLLLLFSPAVCFGALGAATVWEVRTAAASTGGGGFDSGVAVPGTDRSQQDAAFDSGTDLACADGDATPPTVTSATHNFVAADEGNIINITEAGDGFTTGYYLIDDTAGNGAILDRPCGTDGAKTGGDWYLGGASDHPDTVSGVIVAGNTIHIANGVYQPVGANTYVLNTAVAGVDSSPIKWIGYKTSRNDAPTGADRPNFDANSVVGSDVLVLDLASNWFYNIIFENAADDGIVSGSSSDYSTFINCRVTNSGDNGYYYGETIELFNVEIDNNSDRGMNSDSATKDLTFINCYIHDNTGKGIDAYINHGVLAVNTIFESNTGTGLETGGSGFQASFLQIINSIAYNNTGATSDGINASSGGSGDSPLVFVINSSSSSNGRYAFSDVDDKGIFKFFNYNNYFGHTTELNNITAGANDTGDDDPDFTLPGSGDFTYASGSPCLDAGSNVHDPTTGVTGDYKTNIGVDQDDIAGAGAATQSYGFIQ